MKENVKKFNPLLIYSFIAGLSLWYKIICEWKKESKLKVTHLEKNGGAADFAAHGLHVGCPWAARGVPMELIFAMEIRLPTTSIY